MSIMEVLKKIISHKVYNDKYHFSEDNIQCIAIGDVALGDNGEYKEGALVKTNASILIIYDLNKFDDHALIPNFEINLSDLVHTLKLRFRE